MKINNKILFFVFKFFNIKIDIASKFTTANILDNPVILGVGWFKIVFNGSGFISLYKLRKLINSFFI